MHIGHGTTSMGEDGTPNGKNGGDSGVAAWGGYNPTGGAGNPNGKNYGNNAINFGTGGLLIINTEKLIGGGNIESNGSKSDDSWSTTGGGSGAGSINIFTKQISNEINITANGVKCSGAGHGGTGGNGSITIGNIATGTFIEQK